MQSARDGKINNLCLEACECDMTRIIERGGAERSSGNSSERSQPLHLVCVCVFVSLECARVDAPVGVQSARSSD